MGKENHGYKNSEQKNSQSRKRDLGNKTIDCNEMRINLLTQKKTEKENQGFRLDDYGKNLGTQKRTEKENRGKEEF